MDMKTRLKSAAIMMALIITISVFTSVAATTTVAAHTTTTTKITASNSYPAVNQKVTFNVTLKAGTTGLSRPVKIWHIFNGVTYVDHDDKYNIGENGEYGFTKAFSSPGKRIYYARFAGDSKYASSTSTVTVYVGTKTTTTITASNKYPATNEWVLFTVTLKAGTTGLSKPVKIWVTTPDGKTYIYEDGTHPTNKQGVYLFSQNWLTKGKYIYRARFAGDSQYGASSSSVTVYVGTKTTTTIAASNKYPAIDQAVTFNVTLKAGTTGLSKPVKIWHTKNGVRYEDGTHNTVNGVYSFTLMFGSNGQRIYHAQFAGDSESKYASSTGTVTVNVQPIPTTMTIKASKTSGVFPNDPVTFTVTLKAGSIGLSKPVKMWLYKDGVLIGNREGNTVNGVYSFTTSFTKPGKYDWYAQFAGDSPYAQANSILTVYVQPNIG